MKPANVLIIIIDCLRYDRVSPQYMPWLYEFGQQNTWFSNYWSTSHCTDPSITSLLNGRWPDELKLYSMMFESYDYSIPLGVEMLPQTAKKHGYETGTLSNLGRWYTWGVDRYVNTRGWHGSDIFKYADSIMSVMKQPWLMIVHDDSCHTNYRGGSYDQACREVDSDLEWLIGRVLKHQQWTDNTFVIVTADHGEGLGERGIDQHGRGLWPFLTHVPLIIRQPRVAKALSVYDGIVQPVNMHGFMVNCMSIAPEAWPPGMNVDKNGYAHMVGRDPKVWNRGVTNGKHMVIKRQEVGGPTTMFYLDIASDQLLEPDDRYYEMWHYAQEHAAQFGIDAGNDSLDDEILEARLKGLGYFD
ncbi:MAG: hypothetical protein A2W25_11830 [candidate division Zixibacteria bacterium RBG_16_53_22]|nr:MAG: hypothetical protein A2W25_11830 [candidate division Zixibacteria bacterium RBG_16_53_22]